MSIGIFDSGLGGLTVLKEVRKIFPNEEIFYFGDTARVPYGEKTKELIIRYSKEITDFLLTKNINVLDAGNYGGNLGPYHFKLREIMSAGAGA